MECRGDGLFQQEKLQADWCKHIKDKKSPLIHMALVAKKKAPSVGVQHDILPDVPNMFLFPSDEGYEGDEYERLRCESGASNPTGLLNMLGQNEINEDLQKMNDAQLDENDNEEEHESDEVDEEKEVGTNAAEVDDETLEETEQNKKSNKKGRQPFNQLKGCQQLVEEKLGCDIMCSQCDGNISYISVFAM